VGLSDFGSTFFCSFAGVDSLGAAGFFVSLFAGPLSLFDDSPPLFDDTFSLFSASLSLFSGSLSAIGEAPPAVTVPVKVHPLTSATAIGAITTGMYQRRVFSGT
jgi:hypothetical protein